MRKGTDTERRGDVVMSKGEGKEMGRSCKDREARIFLHILVNPVEENMDGVQWRRGSLKPGRPFTNTER